MCAESSNFCQNNDSLCTMQNSSRGGHPSVKSRVPVPRNARGLPQSPPKGRVWLLWHLGKSNPSQTGPDALFHDWKEVRTLWSSQCYNIVHIYCEHTQPPLGHSAANHPGREVSGSFASLCGLFTYLSFWPRVLSISTDVGLWWDWPGELLVSLFLSLA